MSEEYIYFLRAKSGDGCIKIGYSTNTEQRLLSFMSWSPIPLEIILAIPGTSRLECNIHSCFADTHSHGEWFHPSQRLLDAIKAMQGGVPASEAIDLTDIRGNIRFKMAEATRKRNGSPTAWESRRAKSEAVQ